MVEVASRRIPWGTLRVGGEPVVDVNVMQDCREG